MKHAEGDMGDGTIDGGTTIITWDMEVRWDMYRKKRRRTAKAILPLKEMNR